MLHEMGVVSDVFGCFAVVETQSQKACGSCSAVNKCGSGMIEKQLSNKTFSCKVNNSIDAKIGDQVTLAIDNVSLIKASLLVYMVPLLSFLLFALVAWVFIENEEVVILLSLCGLVLGFSIIKFYNYNHLNNEFYLPKMVSIVNTNYPRTSS